MQRTIETTYTDFVNKVSAGRKMNFNAVDSIAQGRVWSGSDAMKIGLVDGFRRMTAAVEEAAKMAGLEAWSLRELPVTEDPLLKCFHSSGQNENQLPQERIGEFERIFDELRKFATSPEYRPDCPTNRGALINGSRSKSSPVAPLHPVPAGDMIRNILYDKGLIRSEEFGIPVICIGILPWAELEKHRMPNMSYRFWEGTQGGSLSRGYIGRPPVSDTYTAVGSRRLRR
jgi:hypothetical protein